MIEVTIAPPIQKYNTQHDELGRFTYSSAGGGAIPQSGPVEAGIYKVWRAGQPDPDNPRGMWFAGGEEEQAKEFAGTYLRDDRSIKQWDVYIENPLVVEGQIFAALSVLEKRPIRDIMKSRDNWMNKYRRENYNRKGVPFEGKPSDGVAWIRMADAKMLGKLKSRGYDAVVYRHKAPSQQIEVGIPSWNTDAIVIKSDSVEKYNQNHDELGRFTFSGQGVGAGAGPAKITDRLIAGTGHTITIYENRFHPDSDDPMIMHLRLDDGNIVEIIASPDAKKIMQERYGDDHEQMLREVTGGITDVVSQSRTEDLARVAIISITTTAESDALKRVRGGNAGGAYVNGGLARTGADIIELNAAGKFIGPGTVQSSRASIARTLKHEIGHAGWASLSPEQRVRYAELVGHPTPNIFRQGTGYNTGLGPSAMKTAATGTRVSATSLYGSNNILESWAETYKVIDWGFRSPSRKMSPGGWPKSQNTSWRMLPEEAMEEVAQW